MALFVTRRPTPINLYPTLNLIVGVPRSRMPFQIYLVQFGELPVALWLLPLLCYGEQSKQQRTTLRPFDLGLSAVSPAESLCPGDYMV
jgi:hypothetical protein